MVANRTEEILHVGNQLASFLWRQIGSSALDPSEQSPFYFLSAPWCGSSFFPSPFSLLLPELTVHALPSGIYFLWNCTVVYCLCQHFKHKLLQIYLFLITDKPESRAEQQNPRQSSPVCLSKISLWLLTGSLPFFFFFSSVCSKLCCLSFSAQSHLQPRSIMVDKEQTWPLVSQIKESYWGKCLSVRWGEFGKPSGKMITLTWLKMTFPGILLVGKSQMESCQPFLALGSWVLPWQNLWPYGLHLPVRFQSQRKRPQNWSKTKQIFIPLTIIPISLIGENTNQSHKSDYVQKRNREALAFDDL